MKHLYMNTDVNLMENVQTLTLQCIHKKYVNPSDNGMKSEQKFSVVIINVIRRSLSSWRE